MRIIDLKLFTTKLNPVIDFYANAIQLPIIDQDNSQVSFQAGWTILRFQEYRASQSPVYHIAFNVPLSSIRHCLARLNQLKINIIPFEGKDIIEFPNWKARSVYFFDPAGNILEFIGRADRPDSEPPAYDTSIIECISEIGVPLEHWPDQSMQIQQQFQLPLYKAAADSFRPLGDPEGLLITVPAGRNWFLTEIPGRNNPLEFLLQENQQANWTDKSCNFSMFAS